MTDDSNTLRTREIELETQGLAYSLKRLEETWSRARLSDSKAGTSFMRMALLPITKAVRKEQKRVMDQKAKPRYWQELIAIEANRLAYITILTILDGFRGSSGNEKLTKYTALAKTIGEWARLEFRVDQEPDSDRVRSWVAEKRDKNPSRAAKRYKPFSKRGIEGKKYLIKLGGALVDLAIEHGEGLFELSSVVMQSKRVRLTQKGMRVLARVRHHEECSIRPRFYPMISPPKPWNGLEGGGYPDLALSLVKRDEDMDVQQALKKADLRNVCEAVNALQATPYRINKRILSVLKVATKNQSPLEVLPYIEILPMPERLPKKTKPNEEWKKRQIERYRVGKLRRLATRNLAALDTRLSVATMLAEAQFYFPHQVDLRGRVYPVPQEVQPQGDDMSRALLEFGRGMPLGERGVYWLAVHLANLYGHKIEKLSLKKRYEWVREHQSQILDSADAPLEGKRFWAGAEKKWRFLAAAFEWAGYAKEGPDYVSHMPIAMDGTCNGMQHLSALGRDPVGAAWTNLVPSNQPQDLYQEVANRLQAIVDDEAAQGDPLPLLWKPCIKRSLVKQATMTTPYGVTLAGMKAQLRNVILEDKAYRARFEDAREAARYLAPRVQRAIGQVVKKAGEIRTWLRKITKKLARADRGISWTVPTGFPVLHEYREEEKHRIETVRGKVLIWEPDSKLGIKTRKQTNSIVPNLIHSLDATHMMQTVRELWALGVKDLSMVHDSYATHAAHVNLMQSVLREQFRRLHTDFTLEEFLKQVKRGAPGVRFTKRLAPPECGSLDLQKVLKSDYLFS